jgi:hypothetical protein
MDETSIYAECELKHIGEGYDPPEAAELCADKQGRLSDEEGEKAGKDTGWEYWFG